MAKHSLKITTPHGTFTRVSTTAYTHAVVRTSERAHAAFVHGGEAGKAGVHGRWCKDRGFAITWHGSEQAALNAAAKPYMWDKATGPAKVYKVTED